VDKKANPKCFFFQCVLSSDSRRREERSGVATETAQFGLDELGTAGDPHRL